MCAACVWCIQSLWQLRYFCLQACNYWTKSAAFSQCLRQCSTLIGARKSRKISLSWSMSKQMPPLPFMGSWGLWCEEGREVVFASQVAGISLWSRCSWPLNCDCGLLLSSGARGLRAHGSSDLSLSTSSVILLFLPRKQKRQRKGFCTSCLSWAFSQCHSLLAGDLQEPKQG